MLKHLLHVIFPYFRVKIYTMKNLLLMLALLFSASTVSLAQKFLRPFDNIATKKISYVTMKDGSEKEGMARKMKRKKGIYKSISLKDENGKKKELEIEKIDFAYLPQSGWDAFAKGMDFLHDATQWDQGMHDLDRIKDGYAYFETIEVKIKKKKSEVLLMQLLNPGTCSRIKIYHDPRAGETMGLGIGGIQVTGGDEKSYYVSKDGEMAWKLKKKDVKKKFDELFGDCDVTKEQFDRSWSNFEATVFLYNEKCTK